MRTFASVLSVLVLALFLSCSSPTSLLEGDITGTYTLKSINNEQVPTVLSSRTIETAVDGREERVLEEIIVESATLTLEPHNHFSFDAITRTSWSTQDGQIIETDQYDENVTGKWERSEEDLSFSEIESDGGLLLGAVFYYTFEIHRTSIVLNTSSDESSGLKLTFRKK